MEKLENLDLPSYWEKKRFKNIFTFNKGLTITKENLEEEGVKCVNYGEIHSKYGFELNPEIHELKCVNESYLKNNVKSLISYGDFVFADTSEDIEGSGNFTHINSQEKIFAGYHTLICRTTKPINSKFFAYLFDSKSFRSQVQKKVKGVKVYSITQNILKDTLVWVPKDDEQTKIASFLDEKTSQIDNAISQKEKLIELLKERRQITINEAVTKGLDKNVEFKDSDVEWIGEIPKHWEVIKFKHLFYEKKKAHNINLNCGSISFGKVVKKDDEKVPLSTKASYQVLNKGEFLINPLNLNYDLKSLRIGLSDFDVVVSSGYIVIKNRIDLDKNYFNWLLHRYDIAFMKTLGAGVRQTLNYRDIGETLLVNPPKEEQGKIAEYIETQTAKIDKAIELQQNYISKLKEYKASLIDSVVTGKVRVV
jgi:type I restriction enzyme S subunit